ncbi:MAG TPA: PTS sugar transporter subunit IIB [Symbiobacteriaceae bacterium]|nr:PTS sugar transporter subunit IIB [Symbiobacteriaceae bacterium]
MKKILLCCSAGMSTSLLVERMKKAAQERQLQVDIEAIPVAEFESRVDEADAVLLGPQVKYRLAAFKQVADAKGKPIDVIDMVAYGMVNGPKVLDQALALIK